MELVHLPQLTHLSIAASSDRLVVDGILAGCKQLRALALVGGFECWSPPSGFIRKTGTSTNNTSSFRPDGYRLEDPRAVAFLCHDFMADWIAFARGEKNMWNVAEEVVDQRLRILASKSEPAQRV